MDLFIQQALSDLLAWSGTANLGLRGLALDGVDVGPRGHGSFTVEQATRVGPLTLHFEDAVLPAIPLLLAKMVEERLEYHELSFLIGSAVHDCKNPLAVLSGYLELLSWQDPHNEYIAHMEAQITSLNFRLEEILAGVNAYPLIPVDACRVASQLVEELSPYYAHRGITLSFEGEPTWVLGDHRRLRRVLNNLVENAEEAITPPGRIVVTVGREQDWVRIEVQDTGPGVNREVESRLFRVGYTTKPTGHGLGLIFSRRSIEAMGGSLTYRPSDTGATFVVRLVAARNVPADGPLEAGHG